MFHGHVLGYIVREVRALGEQQIAPDEVMAYLEARSFGDQYLPYQYLKAAFLQWNRFFYLFPPGPVAPEMRQSFLDVVGERHAEWTAERFPELLRVRDYFAFMQFAKDEGLVVTVCDANPFSGAFVGCQGFRCYDGQGFVLSRRVGPERGLVVADPGDERLLVALAAHEPALSYEQYVVQLNQDGYVVRGADAGFVVVDRDGNRLYEGYRLHGVYDADTLDSAWTGARGERLRASLNRLLGSELVLSGPHDDWESRNDRRVAGPRWGPQLPAIEFGPENEITNHLSIESLRIGGPQAHHWARLYPQFADDSSEDPRDS